MTGEVMIARRQNFQRVYDLRERVLPGWDDAAAPSTEEMHRTLTLRAVSALGIAFPAWVSDYFRQPKKGMPGRLEALAAEGLLLKVEVEGFEGPAYVHPERFGLLEEVACGSREANANNAALPIRSPGIGPAAGASVVRFRLYYRMLYTRSKAPLRLFHPAHPAPRPAYRPVGSQGSPSARGF